jgi:hypothetical protein
MSTILKGLALPRPARTSNTFCRYLAVIFTNLARGVFTATTVLSQAQAALRLHGLPCVSVWQHVGRSNKPSWVANLLSPVRHPFLQDWECCGSLINNLSFESGVPLRSTPPPVPQPIGATAVC